MKTLLLVVPCPDPVRLPPHAVRCDGPARAHQCVRGDTGSRAGAGCARRGGCAMSAAAPLEGYFREAAAWDADRSAAAHRSARVAWQVAAGPAGYARSRAASRWRADAAEARRAVRGARRQAPPGSSTWSRSTTATARPRPGGDALLPHPLRHDLRALQLRDRRERLRGMRGLSCRAAQPGVVCAVEPEQPRLPAQPAQGRQHACACRSSR